MIYFLVFYCAFSYGWMFSELDNLEKSLIKKLHTAPKGTTERDCKIFALVAFLLSPVWFIFWVLKK